MVCPKCGSQAAEVIGSKTVMKKNRVKRKYSCVKCQQMFTTMEIPMGLLNAATPHS